MKKLTSCFSFLITVFFLGTLHSLSAQVNGTDDDGFTVEIKSPASIAQTIEHGYEAGVCQWIGQYDWGPDLDHDLCGEVVWADDSLGCNPLINSAKLAGKIALIRRGACSFSLKAYYAQKAGAIAVIILNHYNNALDGPCSTYLNASQLLSGMTGLDSAYAVHIPAIFLERATGEAIDGALQNGQKVEVCFTFPRMSSPTSASIYATPISHVAPMPAVTVVYNNRSGATQSNVNLKAEFFNPAGQLEASANYHMASVAPNVDSFIVFPTVTVAPTLGKHKVRFTNNKFTESRDTVYSYFEHTHYTFATDNLLVKPGGVGPTDEDFAISDYHIQNGGLVLTGDHPALATYATFGIANVDSIYTANDPAANVIGIAVYKADVDGNGDCDLISDFTDLGAGMISYQEYVLTGNEEDDALIHVPLTDLINGGPVQLEANSAYYVSLIYDGTSAGNGRCVHFSSTQEVPYANLNGYTATPLYLGQLYPGWQGLVVVERLQLEGFTPGVKTTEPKKLDASKIAISPNPASDMIHLELNLDGINPSVAASILDAKGNTVVATQVERNFRSGVLSFNVEQLPSGTYYVWVRTAEGSVMKPIFKK